MLRDLGNHTAMMSWLRPVFFTALWLGLRYERFDISDVGFDLYIAGHRNKGV
jgi:hypothetical protein